jgi:alpha-1,2-mannosyltransferase
LAALAVVVRLADPVRTTRLWREQSLPAALVIAAMIAMQPVRTDLWLGQVNLVLAAMVMYDLLGARSRRWRGVLVGVAAAIKLTPAIFVLFLLLRGRYREAGNAVAGFLAATGLAAVLLPHDTVRYWTATLWHGNGLGSVERDANKSLLGVADRLLGPAGTPVWAALVVPIALAGLAIAARVADTGRESYALGIVGVTGCLVSPASWSHHWVWFIPCLAGAATAARSRGRATQLAVALGALYFVVATQLTSPAAREFEIVRLADANMYLIAGVALLGFAAAEVRGAADATPSRALRSRRSARTRPAWRSVAGVADPARTASR